MVFWKLSWIIVWNKIESACGSRWNTQIDKPEMLLIQFSWIYWTHLWTNQKELFISHTNNEKYTKPDLLRKNESAILPWLIVLKKQFFFQEFIILYKSETTVKLSYNKHLLIILRQFMSFFDWSQEVWNWYLKVKHKTLWCLFD